jgi:hypothetical protein
MSAYKCMYRNNKLLLFTKNFELLAVMHSVININERILMDLEYLQ